MCFIADHMAFSQPDICLLVVTFPALASWFYQFQFLMSPLASEPSG